MKLGNTCPPRSGISRRWNSIRNVPKRFIIVSNTVGFDDAMQQTNAEPEILYLKSSKYQKRSIAGDILGSEAARTDLDAFLTRDIL